MFHVCPEHGYPHRLAELDPSLNDKQFRHLVDYFQEANILPDARTAERDEIALRCFLSDRLPKTETWEGGRRASLADDAYHAYQMADAFLAERDRQRAKP